MLDLKIKFDDKRFYGWLKALSKKLDSRIDTQKGKVGRYVLNQSKQSAPVDTGLLRNSLRTRIDGTDILIYVPRNSKASNYAYYVHDGRGHRKGDPFIRDEIKDNRRKITKIMSKVFRGL